VLRRLGGVSDEWRFDRMSTVVNPATGHVTAGIAAVAKHDGAVVAVCPPRRGNRKDVWRRLTTPRRNAGGARWPTT
jgi:hypothetical protein